MLLLSHCTSVQSRAEYLWETESASMSLVYSVLTSLRQSHLLQRTAWGTLQRANILPGQPAATRVWVAAQCPCLWKSRWLFTSNFIIFSVLLHGNMLSSHTPVQAYVCLINNLFICKCFSNLFQALISVCFSGGGNTHHGSPSTTQVYRWGLHTLSCKKLKAV